ncbi:hypothetical protein GGQ59_000733 [Parvularcula dongshanensis]|uniref:Uncharacterized protein n=1 Tax=Parvularcula dongshanensis TaxID=1173995 RepID=A0A840I1S6_9PROT|nr:hypothetical protein [Parvularcula dongshanensis]
MDKKTGGKKPSKPEISKKPEAGKAGTQPKTGDKPRGKR